MKFQFFIKTYNIIIILLITGLSFSSIQISSIFPVNKILLTGNLNKLDLATNLKYYIDPKGYGIIFNNTSNVSLIPNNLFDELTAYYKSFEDIIVGYQTYENGLKELIVYATLYYGFETPHFIFETFGISIPTKYYLIEKGESQRYGIIFMTKEDQEYIVFGKDLIDIMKIEFKDENNFIIHNDEFISKFDG